MACYRKYFRGILVFLLSCTLSCACSESGYIAVTGYAQGGVYSVKLSLDGQKVVDNMDRMPKDAVLVASWDEEGNPMEEVEL